jgi:chemotaxis protein MotD
VQASLSALESVLSRESPSGNANTQMKTADDISARGQQQQLAMKDAGITSVRQETHFAPASSQSPALQIAQRITHEMRMGGQNMPQPDVPADTQRPPVRVLHIQLNPPQLGPMTIRMSMQNDGLMIQLETANRETAQIINRDRDALSGMLRAAGYSVDGLNVQVTTAERGANGQAPGQGDGFNQAAGHQQGSREASGRSSDRGGRGGGQRGQSSNPGDQDRASTPNLPSRGGVYL